jgi:hypothetical protein
MYKNGAKTEGLRNLMTFKMPITPFLLLKKYTKYTPETFFEEYIYFKFFGYLRCCGNIPVQSFRSHIRPQPPGLGVKEQEVRISNKR